MPHISEPVLKPSIIAAAQSILKEATTLESRWSREISIGRTAENSTSIYDCFPFLFIEAFPAIPAEKVRRLSLAGRLYASSLFLSDALMDQEMKGLDAAIASVNATVLQSEASHILYELFPPDSQFWIHFRKYLRAYIEACIKEKEFGSRSWQDFTDEVALGIVNGKDGFSRTAIAGLCELSGDDRLFDPLADSINHYYVARQMFDDLIDWKDDLRDGAPSLLLARLLRTRSPIKNTDRNSPEIAEVAGELYYQGHAEYVLELALDALHKADLLTLTTPTLSWRAAIEQAQHHCQLLLRDLRQIVTENHLRASRQPTLEISLPGTDNPWLKLGVNALRYILKQWQTGFGEAQHVMRFSSQYGFSSPKEFQSGDVFQRALITEAICEANEVLMGKLTEVIQYEADYLISSRIKHGVGGWSYFPDLPELPPDADDLAQVMQVLFKAGRYKELEGLCTNLPASSRCGEERSNSMKRNVWLSWTLKSDFVWQRLALCFLFLALFFVTRINAQGTAAASIDGYWQLIAEFPEYDLDTTVRFKTAIDKQTVEGTVMGPTSGHESTFRGKILNNHLLLKAAGPLGEMSVELILSGTNLSGTWLTADLKGRVKGTRLGLPKAEPVYYPKYLKVVCQLIKNSFYDPQLNGVDLEKLQVKYAAQLPLVKDDADFVKLVRVLLKEFKASHMDFYQLPQALPLKETVPPITWRQLSLQTYYLKLRHFDPLSPQEQQNYYRLLEKSLVEIGNSASLVVDLRGNRGGNLNHVFNVLSNFLSPDQAVSLAFAQAGAGKISAFTAATGNEGAGLHIIDNTHPFITGEILRNGAAVIRLKAEQKKWYQGKIVILVDEGCYSGGELFAAILQEKGRAVLMGAHTKGEVLGSYTDSIVKNMVIMKKDTGWRLEIPIIDFRTLKGKRIEGQGVKPDIETTSRGEAVIAEALKYLEQPAAPKKQARSTPGSMPHLLNF